MEDETFDFVKKEPPKPESPFDCTILRAELFKHPALPDVALRSRPEPPPWARGPRDHPPASDSGEPRQRRLPKLLSTLRPRPCGRRAQILYGIVLPSYSVAGYGPKCDAKAPPSGPDVSPPPPDDVTEGPACSGDNLPLTWDVAVLRISPS